MMAPSNGLVAIQRRMIGHAALILLVGMIAGVGLMGGLLGGFEVWPGTILQVHVPGPTEAWVRAHLGGMLNALLIFVVALSIPVLGFDVHGGSRIASMLIGTGWANSLFYWAALLSPNRALTFGDNRFGSSSLISILGLLPALLFSAISIYAVIWVARRAFAQQDS